VGQKTVQISELEAIIREMRGVENVRIVAGKDGVIEEIHVLVRGERPAKQLVRDIESALMARYSLRIDHKKVSIAYAGGGGGNGRKEAAPAGLRLRLCDLALTMDGRQIRAEVRLALNGQSATGSASGHNTPRNQLRVMAEATLRAVEAALAPAEALAVEEATAVKLPGERMAVNVILCAVGPRGEDHLLGSALVRQDPLKAAAQATLDAINRRFGLLRPELGVGTVQGNGYLPEEHSDVTDGGEASS